MERRTNSWSGSLGSVLGLASRQMVVSVAAGAGDSGEPTSGCQVSPDEQQTAEGRRQGWDLRWENDSVIGPYGTDRYYTQGMRLARLYAAGEEPEALAVLDRALCNWMSRRTSKKSRLDWYNEHLLGQHLFTPRDISRPIPSQQDRPYAAWLYVGAALDVTQKVEGAAEILGNGLFHTFELQLGTTGHAAAGEWVQRNWHDLIHAQEPMGWDYQIPAEPGLQLRYGLKALVIDLPESAGDRSDGWAFQQTIDTTLDVGTVAIDLGLGTTARFGRNLGKTVTQNMHPSAIGDPVVASSDEEALLEQNSLEGMFCFCACRGALCRPQPVSGRAVSSVASSMCRAIL